MICGGGTRFGYSVDTLISVQKQECTKHEEKFAAILPPESKPRVIYTDNSLEFTDACEALSWYHDTSIPHRSDTKWTRGKSGLLLQSG